MKRKIFFELYTIRLKKSKKAIQIEIPSRSSPLDAEIGETHPTITLGLLTLMSSYQFKPSQQTLSTFVCASHYTCGVISPPLLVFPLDAETGGPDPPTGA